MVKSQDGPHVIDSISELGRQATFLMQSLGNIPPKKRYRAEMLTTNNGYKFTSNIKADNEIEALRAVLNTFEGAESTIYRIVVDEVVSNGHIFHLAKVRMP